MILWLASYPRSGNTMLRTMLHHVFGCKTYSKYWRDQVPGKTGAMPLPARWPEPYEQFSKARETYLVKTHDGPEDGAKAIYVVRNGLAAIRSYKHYLRDFGNREYSLEQIILGEARFGSWGQHLDLWNPLERADPLVLKYEDLVAHPDEQLQRVSKFTGLTKQAEWVNNFDELHAAHSQMYRQGPKAPPEEGFTEEQQQLFWALHSDWMAAFRYPQPGFAGQRALRTALANRLDSLGAVKKAKQRGSKLGSITRALTQRIRNTAKPRASSA